MGKIRVSIDSEHLLNEIWETMNKLDDGKIDSKRANKKSKQFADKIKIIKKAGIVIDENK